MGSEADASRTRVHSWPSHPAPEMMEKMAIPAIGATPTPGTAPVLSGIPALAAVKVRLATVAARYNWNLVLARPKKRACRIPNCTSRASRCSTTTRRRRYSSKAWLSCRARACCNSASWGCSRTVRPMPALAATHRGRSAQSPHTAPSNWKPSSL